MPATPTANLEALTYRQARKWLAARYTGNTLARALDTLRADHKAAKVDPEVTQPPTWGAYTLPEMADENNAAKIKETAARIIAANSA